MIIAILFGIFVGSATVITANHEPCKLEQFKPKVCKLNEELEKNK